MGPTLHMVDGSDCRTAYGGARIAALVHTSWRARGRAERRSSRRRDCAPSRDGYTMAITIRAVASAIWPWLVQIGQGRGGFYTHEWVENVLRANIHNTDRIVAEWQQLDVGDTVDLTPDPYFGKSGQFMTVAEMQTDRTLVFRQTLPNGSIASWAFFLSPQNDGTTRVIMRRRGAQPTLFDRVMAPGYVLMDKGMLRGIRDRVEAAG